MKNVKIFLFSGILFGVLKPIMLIAGQLRQDEARQIIFVRGKSSAITATLELRVQEGGKERLVFGPVSAVVGRKGIAEVGKKREGDGKTPQGKFKIESAFGYEPKVETKLHFEQVTENDKWIDDVASSQYNQWVKGETSAKSFEVLRRSDDLYKYAFVIGYNRKPVVPGAGSAIFGHVWKDSKTGTAGCVAISETDMKNILRMLDKNLNPEIVISATAVESLN
ncbi:MAG: hypothetical protein A4S09_15360 [Proteobacteria bacterium SG_bin7]|nr:MAG: hypothetical protein A4S09_15360 [Proteobacteria bacterium SG_bin7]